MNPHTPTARRAVAIALDELRTARYAVDRARQAIARVRLLADAGRDAGGVPAYQMLAQARDVVDVAERYLREAQDSGPALSLDDEPEGGEL